MNNISKTYNIYTIRTYTNNNLIYYNITTQPISKCLSALKSRYNRYLNKKDNYVSVFQIIKTNNSYIQLEEKIECVNRDIALTILNNYIKNNDCINKENNENKESNEKCNESNKENNENNENKYKINKENNENEYKINNENEYKINKENNENKYKINKTENNKTENKESNESKKCNENKQNQLVLYNHNNHNNNNNNQKDKKIISFIENVENIEPHYLYYDNHLLCLENDNLLDDAYNIKENYYNNFCKNNKNRKITLNANSFTKTKNTTLKKNFKNLNYKLKKLER